MAMAALAAAAAASAASSSSSSSSPSSRRVASALWLRSRPPHRRSAFAAVPFAAAPFAPPRDPAGAAGGGGRVRRFGGGGGGGRRRDSRGIVGGVGGGPLVSVAAASASSSSSAPADPIGAGGTAAATTPHTEAYDEDDDSVLAHTVPRRFVPVPFQYHEELTLRVESLTNLGLGVCRSQVHDGSDPHPDSADPLYVADPFHGLSCDPAASDDVPPNCGGWVVMVPNVIPGELIRCRVFRNYPSYSDADLVEVLEPSPQRVEPPCPLFDRCGGCQYQHVSTSEQREWKRRQVADAFARVGKLGPDEVPEISPTAGTDEVYRYRSKITPHYDAPGRTPLGTYEIEAIGFKEKTSRRIVDVPYCHIATDAINERLAEYREEKFAEAREGRLRRPKRGATLLLRDAGGTVTTDGNEYVTSSVRGVEFRFRAGNFFQNNPHVLPLMLDAVVEASSRPNAGGEDMTHLIDCYCGSGLFCLGASSMFDVCVGIEVNERAAAEAADNARRNGIANCGFVAASAEAIFGGDNPVTVTHGSTGETGPELVRDFPRDRTVVVIDPPRRGCSREFLAQLAEFGPGRVVYMSCDPATQARDARAIVDAGYKLTSVEPFDLFPQTRHIECLAVFERR